MCPVHTLTHRIMTSLQIAETESWWAPPRTDLIVILLKKKCGITEHFIQYLWQVKLHVIMLGQIYSSRMKTSHVYLWCSICIQILSHFSTYIWSHRTASDCISLEILWSSVLGTRMQRRFIKSDQTWRDSWLPPHSNHFPCVIAPFDWIQLHL